MKKRNQGFTLIEMLLVMLIIGVLIFLFAPNLSKHGDSATQKGNEALVQVVETQVELFKLENDGGEPTKANLVPEYLTEEQWQKYSKLEGNTGG